MVKIRKIVTSEAYSYLKNAKGLNEEQSNDELLVLKI